jgi:hypothetical protein
VWISIRAQSIRNGTFAKFDYGKKNAEVYGQDQPPLYDLGSIHGARIAVFYGGEDKLTCKEDVERLIAELPKESVAYVQYEEEYGHLDFVWGDDAHIRFVLCRGSLLPRNLTKLMNEFRVYMKMVQLARENYDLAEARREKEEKEKAMINEGESSEDPPSSRKAGSRKGKGKGSRKKQKKEEQEKKKKRKKTKEHQEELEVKSDGNLASLAAEEPGVAEVTLAEA